MSITHILVGENAAKNLREAMLLDESLQGNIITLSDQLNLGPLYAESIEHFATVRKEFWQTLQAPLAQEDDNTIDDATQIHELLRNQSNETQVWFWMAPNVADTMAYFWLLPYFQPHNGLLQVISINALPFFNEKGQLYYPSNFAQILPKEIVKCKRLAKEVSLADYEVDIDEWKRIAGENAMLRTLEGHKKIMSRNETHYDLLLYNAMSGDFQKANKVIHQVVNKNNVALPESYFAYRLKQLIENGKFEVNGDMNKTLKDFEVKKAGKTEAEQAVEETA